MNNQSIATAPLMTAADAHATEVARGERFEFGSNWARFLEVLDEERILSAERALQDMYDLLAPLERKTSPFTTTPKTNEKAHWVKPEVVVQVRFNEMTNEGKLRQPIFLGVRDDKDPEDVRLEF